MPITIITGDCRKVMKGLPDNSVDSIVTDPPYHLTTGKKGGTGEASVNLSTPHGRARISTGFMGKQWDGGDVAFQPATWRECLRVLKPGGFVVAFGGTRTYHRLVCAIEDAGFEVRDMLAWLYGQGFPKGTDKAKIPAEWDGWNTALKPGIEPICLARKPMPGTLAQCLTQFGTGAMNISGCRIGLDGDYKSKPNGRPSLTGLKDRYDPDSANIQDTVGRWPANVLHDGSNEVLEAFPNAPGQLADAKTSGDRKFGNVYSPMRYGRSGEPSADSENTGDVGFKMKPGARRHDAGSAARFFYCAKASQSDRNEGLEGGDTNTHPTVKPTDTMRWLCRLVTPPGGTILDPFLGSGSTLKAAKLEGFSGIGIELLDEHASIAQRRISIPAQQGLV